MEVGLQILIAIVAILAFWFYSAPKYDEEPQNDSQQFEKSELGSPKYDEESRSDLVELEAPGLGVMKETQLATLETVEDDEEKPEILTYLQETMHEHGLSLDDVMNAELLNFSSIDPSVIPEDEHTIYSIILNECKAIIENFQIHALIYNQHPEENSLYNKTKFNNGIVAIGVGKFLSAVVAFCQNEGRRGEIEIISIGSGDGTIEDEIIRAYRSQFGSDLRITLVDLNPKFKVDFKTVDEMIEKHPTVIGNCVLLIFWPVQRAENFDDYDIEAVYKLQPHAVLTVYEAANGASGSMSFEKLLYDKSLDLPPSKYGFANYQSKFVEPNYEARDYGLDNYLIQEIARQDIFITPTVGTYIYRMVKLTRIK